MARALASHPDGTWRRLITDPTGRLLDYGRTTYRPPKPLADFVRARSQTCAFPTCNRRAESCDLDHVCPWSDDGRTCPENLVPLCSRHHHLKHDTAWTMAHDPTTGVTTWTTPHGRTITNVESELPIGVDLPWP